ILEIQRQGDPAADLPPSPEAVQPAVEALAGRWTPVREGVDAILAGREPVLAVRQFEPLLEEVLPRLQVLTDDIAAALIQGGAPPRQVYMVSRQLLLAQRIADNFNRMLDGGAEAPTAADQFGRDMALFGRVLGGLQSGDAQLGVEQVTAPAVAAQVRQLGGLFEEVAEGGRQVLTYAPDLFQVQNAAQAVSANGDALLAAVTNLLEQYRALGGGVEVAPGVILGPAFAYGLGALALLLLIVLGLLLLRDARLRQQEAEQRRLETDAQNRRNQDAIMRLLDEMGDLAEGNLTVQASVTEDITGAIADSINYAIEELRTLVSTINATSERVAAAAQETRAVADRLASASEVQARQIDSSSRLVTQMAGALNDVSQRTASSAEVAENSVRIAHEGGDRVRRTIQGMDAIREHIQETSKRIKRLGESSQEIGNIVELINDIADQTNILALNAAIQASAAGEAGRGFAVVADEVQRLAERSGNATKRIEALVKTIQADTNEAVISMEKSTTEVVHGAGLAETAGEALNEIETVSARLAQLIDEVSTAARQCTEMAAKVSSTMASINEITAQTAEGSSATATSIGKLTQLAQELRQSVAGFRLPEPAGG
nr:methyl-accepting chemotaxis protein [Pseudomonadota bacterium]